MNLDERVNFHEQRLLSIARNLGALVEAQPRTELRVQELAEAQQRTDREMNTVLTVTAGLAQVENQRMLRDLGGRVDQLTGRVDQLAVRMDELAVRMDELAGRMDQLAATLQRFLESQTGRNGHN
ncbi:MAG: hypothetical protein HY238_14450 [Acidobacteria bacterium]|nr:hypothetical protein [Acidobacteriota bacterium]